MNLFKIQGREQSNLFELANDAESIQELSKLFNAELINPQLLGSSNK
ncbi:hypothetical protein BN938_3019 [Mucinivorans hirudinis]|uniref:Uncharacterized protein n=1 Tax=Mucinivorans hirudinis TaxID=1433126 RepID=A0A060RBQ0_9BACT|nr:hypothetical protein BN938_3019 [Mucinivorans hirudinis]